MPTRFMWSAPRRVIRHLALLLTLSLSCLGSCEAQDVLPEPPTLIRDLNTCPTGLASGQFIRAGKSFFFRRPLFDFKALFGVLDSSGVRNIRVRGFSSVDTEPYFLGAVDGIVYFGVDTDSSLQKMSMQLWRSDGTEAGTAMVKALNTEGISQIRPFGKGSFVFSAKSAEFGAELWVSDGTSDGTRVIDTIVPGPGDTFATMLTSSGLIATSIGAQRKLSLYQLTPRLTLERVDGILPQSATGNFEVHTPIDGELIFFSMKTNENGSELWVTDGTASGTRFVKDLVPGVASPKWVIGSKVRGARAYFLVTENSGFQALWESNGTPAGTRMIYPFNPDLGFKNINFLTPTGNGVVFQADTYQLGRELWFSDGTVEGTAPITERPGKLDGGNISMVEAVPGSPRLTLVGLEMPNIGTELYVTDGTRAGTSLVKDGMPGQFSSYPVSVGASDSGKVAYFARTQGGQELFESDGTVDGTQMILRVATGVTDDSYVGSVLSVPPSRVFFSATTDCLGTQQLFSFNTSTLLLEPIRVNPVEGERSTGISLKGSNSKGVFFFNATDTQGAELWFTDGTSAGTGMTADINPGRLGSALGSQYSDMLGDKLFFFANNGKDGIEPYISDGTAAGTRQISDIYQGSGSSLVYRSPISTGKLVVFVARSGSDAIQIASTDGTPGNITVLREYRGTAPTGPHLYRFRDRVIFVDEGSADRSQVWSTDGTKAGTSLLLDVKPYSLVSEEPLHVVGSKILIPIKSSNRDALLLLSDGTVSGTARVVPPSEYGKLGSLTIKVLSVKGDHALLSLSTQKVGQELWSLNTQTGALSLVSDLESGPGGSSLGPAVSNSSVTFFAAMTSQSGSELWMTKGTEVDTRQVLDFHEGPKGSGATPKYVNDGMLFTTYNASATGGELYYLLLIDSCPDDPVKYAPGACGCGVADMDSDRDGIIDCLVQDLCPADPMKSRPGLCGCGVSDADKNGDSVVDCVAVMGLQDRIRLAIARLKALRLPQRATNSINASRALKKQIAVTSAFAHGVLREIGTASRTIPALTTKESRRAREDARIFLLKLRKTMSKRDLAGVVRSFSRISRGVR